MNAAVNKLKKDIWKDEADQEKLKTSPYASTRARRPPPMRTSRARGNPPGRTVVHRRREVHHSEETPTKTKEEDEPKQAAQPQLPAKTKEKDSPPKPERSVETKEILESERVEHVFRESMMMMPMQQTAVSKIRRSIFQLPVSSQYTEYYPPEPEDTLQVNDPKQFDQRQGKGGDRQSAKPPPPNKATSDDILQVYNPKQLDQRGDKGNKQPAMPSRNKTTSVDDVLQVYHHKQLDPQQSSDAKQTIQTIPLGRQRQRQTRQLPDQQRQQDTDDDKHQLSPPVESRHSYARSRNLPARVRKPVAPRGSKTLKTGEKTGESVERESGSSETTAAGRTKSDAVRASADGKTDSRRSTSDGTGEGNARV